MSYVQYFSVPANSGTILGPLNLVCRSQPKSGNDTPGDSLLPYLVCMDTAFALVFSPRRVEHWHFVFAGIHSTFYR